MNNRNLAMIKEWQDWATPRKRHQTVACYLRDFKHLAEWLGDRGFAQVALSDLERFLDRRGEVAPATRQRESAELRSLFRWLHQRAYIPTNPASDLVGAKVANVMPKPVADEDWVKLWGLDLDPVERAAYGLAMFCGLRRQEVCWLTKGQVASVPTPRLVSVERKGGSRHDLPWLSMATLHAQRMPHLLPDLGLFTRCVHKVAQIGAPTRQLVDFLSTAQKTVTPNTYAHRMAERVAEAGVTCTPHMLRHACATNLIRMGVEVTVVSRLMHHGSLDMTMRYVKHSEDPIQAYLDAPAIAVTTDPVVDLVVPSRYGAL